MAKEFKGAYSILLLPLHGDGSLDLKGLESLIEHNLSSGVQGLVILGSNGEFPYLSIDEKKAVIRTASATNAKRAPLICGASSAFTREAIELAEFSQQNGVDALLTVLPCYYPVPFKDLLGHYRALCSAVSIPVFYYHFPEMTGLYLSASEFKEVLSIPGMAGAKNSQVNFPFFEKALSACGGMGKAIFTGAEFNLLSALKLGGAGAMGPLCNIWPEKVLQVYNHALAGKFDEAARAQLELFCLMPLMGGPLLPERAAKAGFDLVSRPMFSGFYKAKATMAMLKEAVRQCGVAITPTVRAPLPALTNDDRQKVEKVLARMKAIQSRG